MTTQAKDSTPQRLHVWDLPTRLFHWLLATAIPAAITTGMIGGELIVWHGRLGLLILGLVAFRLVWGIIGTRNARFAQFVRGPRAILAYLRGEWRGVGHNPLGALSVLAMLGLIAVQIGSGLFANDDIAFRGPLADQVSDDVSSRLTSLHSLLQYGLIAVVVLHAVAIAWYVKVKRENLLRPMVTGWKEVPSAVLDAGAGGDAAEKAGAVQDATGSETPGALRTVVAFLVAAAFAGALVYSVAQPVFGTAPSAAPAAAPAAPAW